MEPISTRADTHRRLTLGLAGVLLTCAVLLLCQCATALALAPPSPRVTSGPGEIVPIPASISHDAGDMVDRRIIPNLRWLAQRFPIHVTDGFSGKLPSGEQVGCRGCHTRGSDHHNGLAVDIVPLNPSSRCDSNWTGITQLALWAEPRPNRPVAPFRWVGYDGDAGHGCGHHLHLSWNHAPAAASEVAAWVEVFAVDFAGGEPSQPPVTKPPVTKPPVKKPRKPVGKRSGVKAPAKYSGAKKRPAKPKPVKTVETGPPGGISSVKAGGVGAQ